MNKTIREIKDELHEMFPQYRGFIEHTLVATMCNQYHIKQGQTLPIDSVSGWRSFDTPPKSGQEILIVWEKYPPEKRILTDEDLAKNWDGMRWLPIPAYR